MNAHYHMLANLQDPNCRFHKRNSKRVRSMRRAQKTIDSWSIGQLEAWLNKAEHKDFKMWYKYKHMVEQALMVARPDNYVPF